MKRRIRTDLQSRDYHCPCGKSYLSYSALHTHIRKYHRLEENMLQNASKPKKPIHKRGRPKDKKQVYISQEFEELTMFETAVLKIYEELSAVIDEPILLQGDAQVDQSAYQQQYKQLLQHQALTYSEVASEKDIQYCESILNPIICSLIKHFNINVSIRIKLMIIVGYLEFYYHSSPKEECLARMSMCGWREAGTSVSELLYDVLMRALQRRGQSELVLPSNDQ